ncbi:MAG: hypothetical protein OEX22_04660 [Cyclobacteriaceae bacterium]|nr:hypothetical protein [Cyclobacteriaceae bacterium]
MKKFGWFFYWLSAIFLIIKLTVICWQQYNLHEVAYSGEELTFELLFDLAMVRGFLIEPTLIALSLIGFIIRNNTGFALATIFSYFIMTNMLLNLTPFELYFTTTDIAQLLFALMVIIPIHYKKTLDLFFTKWTPKKLLKINLSVFSLGLGINIAYQLILESFLN